MFHRFWQNVHQTLQKGILSTLSTQGDAGSNTLPGVPQVKDRVIVAERMKQHVQAADTTPLLIFPEGTCVNNEYCVMFKRGAFDLGATVCPVAIKYNKVFVDAFWNSKRQSFTAHLVSGCGFQFGTLRLGRGKYRNSPCMLDAVPATRGQVPAVTAS